MINWSEYLPRDNGPALSDGHATLSYQQLLQSVSARALWLSSLRVRVVALELENGIDWVLFDMACAQAGMACIPIPGFFSASQRRHALDSAGVDLILSANGRSRIPTQACFGVIPTYYASDRVDLPEGTAKITFTSGSTGQPRGVCLSTEQQLKTAQSLVNVIGMTRPVHLCILPLPTLLENVAGIYAPLLAGGTVYVPGGDCLGFNGSRLIQPECLLAGLNRFLPDSVILVPELLALLVGAAEQGWQVPRSLQFIAVGGARVSASLLGQASRYGLPVYQGYGLSECASVVCLNTPDHNLTGSIGRPLPHLCTSIVEGELEVSGNTFLGYLDDTDSWYKDSVRTADLVSLNDDGYFSFDGRRGNRMINSFGRNISPEWPESELLGNPYLHQAVVIGNDRPHCMALLVPDVRLKEGELIRWLEDVNSRLPDYARIEQCLLLNQPMDSRVGLYTSNGRPNRAAIEHHFEQQIESLYRQPHKRLAYTPVHEDLVQQQLAAHSH